MKPPRDDWRESREFDGRVTRHEKPLLLVISGNGWAPNLDDVHVIS
jgi:hypothetical protein